MRALLAHVLFTSKHFDFKQGQARGFAMLLLVLQDFHMVGTAHD